MKLTKILQYVPEGTKIWSPVYGDCEFSGAFDSGDGVIYIRYGESHMVNLGGNGEICPDIEGSECIIFPSRENRDWTNFARKFIPEGTSVMCSDGNMWVYGIMQKDGLVKTRFAKETSKLVNPKYLVPFEEFIISNPDENIDIAR